MSSSKAWAASIVGITNHGAPTAVSEPADPRAPRKGRQAPPSYKAGRRRRDRRWSRRSWENLKMAAKRIYSYYIREIRSEEHTSELQSLMRISYAVFCLKKKKNNNN